MSPTTWHDLPTELHLQVFEHAAIAASTFDSGDLYEQEHVSFFEYWVPMSNADLQLNNQIRDLNRRFRYLKIRW